ncbi:MAG: DMT family transporter, partial [Patescibacteria group bacterium]
MNKNKYYVLLALVAVIWSSTNFFTKDLLSKLGPMSILFFRFLIPVGILTFVNLVRRKSIFKEWKIGLLTGLFLASFYVFQNYSLTLTKPVNASFFLNGFVLFVPFLAYFLEKKKMAILDFFTIVLALIGLYFISGNLGGFGTGEALACLGALFYA